MAKNIIEVFFDVETKKFFDDVGKKDPSLLGVSVVSVYRRTIDENFKELMGEMRSFWEEDFEKMWPIFSEAKRIVGFNSLKFDVPALKPYAPKSFQTLAHFDILDEIRRLTNHKVSLNRIAKETLKRQKIDSGANAGIYWAKHDEASLKKLKKYCEEDVRITRDIYDFALTNKHLIFKDHWNTLRKVEVDFTYKIEEGDSVANQGSLF